MVKIDLEGNSKQFEKFFLPPDAYVGKIVEISDIKEGKGFEGKDVEKLVVTVEVNDSKKSKIPFFLSAVVKHAGKQKGYSDSKLYTFLEKANLLIELKAYWATIENKQKIEQNVDFSNWLRIKLVGRDIKFTVKTVVPKEGDKYSCVAEVLKFTDQVETERVV